MGDPPLLVQRRTHLTSRLDLSFVLELALLLVHASYNDSDGEAEVVLLLLERAGLQIIGFQAQRETVGDAVVDTAASHYRAAGTDFGDLRPG